MAKKNNDKPKVSLTGAAANPISSMYKLLAMIGVISSKDDILAPYELPGVHLSIAIPAIKFGIAFETDDIGDLEDHGWHIQNVVHRDVEPFSRIFSAIDAARIARTYAHADPNVKTTSQAEERLFTEMIRRGLPIPDRNLKFKRDNGTELTTPDFAWEKYQIAFFMDGAYWHSIKDDQQIIKDIRKSKKLGDDIVQKRKDKVRKDGAIRTELGSMGWIVLSCTDEDIESSEGLHETVDLIERTLMRAESAQQFRDKVPLTSEQEGLFTSLLTSSSESSPESSESTPESIISDLEDENRSEVIIDDSSPQEAIQEVSEVGSGSSENDKDTPTDYQEDSLENPDNDDRVDVHVDNDMPESFPESILSDSEDENRSEVIIDDSSPQEATQEVSVEVSGYMEDTVSGDKDVVIVDEEKEDNEDAVISPSESPVKDESDIDALFRDVLGVD